MAKKRKDYKKVYRDYFGIGDDDVVLSELSGQKADDIHHIIFKSQGGKDEIENLIALTRDEHDRAHFKKKTYLYAEELQEIHNKRL